MTEGRHSTAEEALDRMTDGFIALDDEWTVTYVNETAREILGIEETPEVGQLFWDAFPGIYDSKFGEAYREAMETQDPVTVESYYPPLGGWYRVNAYPDEDGLSIYFQDVTEKKDLEAELRRENELRERVIETAPTGIAVLAADGTFLRANERMTELVGLSEADLGTTKYDDSKWQLYDREGEPLERGELPIDRVFETGEAVSDVEHSLRKPDGTELWLSVSAAPLWDADGEIERIVVVVDDHTDQRWLEERLRESATSLRQLYEVAGDRNRSFEAKLREILSIGRERLGVELGFLTEISEDTQTIAEAVGDHELIQPGESCPLSQAYCKRTIEEESFLAVYDAIEYGWEDTEQYDVFELGCYIGGKVIVDDELYGTLCFADHSPRGDAFTESETTFVELLTQWVSYEIERRRTRERMERQNERLDDFASVVSHDLRNPLNIAAARVELAQESGDVEHLDDAADALARMEELIDDMLALARHGEEVVETDPIPLADAVEQAWESLADTRDATLVVADDLETVNGDESRIVQLFEKLFGNAVDHAGPDVTVTVGSFDEGVYVADDGPGISPEKREEVFERGFSTDDEGTGFGLGIVAEIVEAHGWDVRVTESASGGARFEILAPTFEVFEDR
jgi:PAS domain S-box-containing protein